MDWTLLEAAKIALLAILAVGLHQLIRHFGTGYATEVFEGNPSMRRNFLVLADCAYYLIFSAYVLLNVHFQRPERIDSLGNPVGYRWTETVSAAQLQDSLGAIAGICLLIGILHGINVFVLPLVGSVPAFRVRSLQGRGS
jgi:hypothetical protein